MDPHKKALLDLKKMARRMRVTGDDEDSMSELEPNRDVGADRQGPLPHFLEEPRSPMDFTQSPTANDLFDFRRKK